MQPMMMQSNRIQVSRHPRPTYANKQKFFGSFF